MKNHTTTPAMTTREWIIERLNDAITFNEAGTWDSFGDFAETQTIDDMRTFEEGGNFNLLKNAYIDWRVFVAKRYDDIDECVIVYDSGGKDNDGDCGYPSVMILCRSPNYVTSYGFLSALKAYLDAVDNYGNIVGYRIIGDVNPLGEDEKGRYSCTLNCTAITENI